MYQIQIKELQAEKNRKQFEDMAMGLRKSSLKKLKRVRNPPRHRPIRVCLFCFFVFLS